MVQQDTSLHKAPDIYRSVYCFGLQAKDQKMF